jgi:3-oxo-5-alpha-steroid 4-dehydrogenase 3
LKFFSTDSIKQTFRYGKHAHKGKSDKLVEKIEIPKAWFKHFYIFSLLWSWLFLYLAVDVYFLGGRPSRFLISYLDFSCGRERAVESEGFLTVTLIKIKIIENYFQLPR